MYIRRFFFSFFFLSLLTMQSNAQTATVKHKIAIFAPLYLDSAFDDLGEYRYAKNAFPKFFNPGLEFVEGAQLALDSMAKEKILLDVFVYDTRSATQSLNVLLAAPEMDSIELLLVHCTAAETKIFADAGRLRKIPVINVNLPNDGGVTENPYWVVLNSTLKTQIEGIYKYMQKYYSLNPAIVFRKKGAMEDRIKNYLDDAGKNTAAVPLNLKYVDLPDSFTVAQLIPLLDSNKHTVCIAGSLDENFGLRLAKQLSTITKEYPATLIGMPTWDGFTLNKPEFKDVEIIYSTPFYNAKVDKVSTRIISEFKDKMFARPSDMVFRGYETTWKYAKMLLQFGVDISSNLSNKYAKVFTDIDIQPVINRQTMNLDFFENKELYFIKWQDGMLKSVN